MKKLAEQIRDAGLKRKVDFLDVRIVESESTNISLQDGKADKLSHGKNQGLGIDDVVVDVEIDPRSAPLEENMNMLKQT